MVYENNPFPSKQGVKYLKGIFDLIYRPEPSDTSQLANDGLKANRDFFNSHKGGLVNYTKRFIGGYTSIIPSRSQDSGIYVCDPIKGGCGRADFMYNWEFVDAGLYDSKNWLGTVTPKKDTIWSQTGYPIITRVRCNDYNHCKDCNATYATANKGGGSCIYCNSTNIMGGGCGMEHMALHLVKEQTVDNINANNVNAIKPTKNISVVNNGKMTQSTGQKPFAFRITCGKLKNDTRIDNYIQAAARIPNLEIGYKALSDGITFYRPNRLVSSLDKNDETFFGTPKWRGKTRTDKIKSKETPKGGGQWILDPEISSLQELYDGGQWDRDTGKKLDIGPIIEAANSEPTRYPISKMKFAFTYDKKIVCLAHSNLRRPEVQLWAEEGEVLCLDCGVTKDPYFRSSGNTCRDCGSSNISKGFDSPRPLEDCPQCGIKTNATNIKVAAYGGVPYIFPRKKLYLKVEKAAGQAILPLKKPKKSGKALNTYILLLVTDDAEDGYAYEVHLDGKYTTIPIPRSLPEANILLGLPEDGKPEASGSRSCPKDPLIDRLGNVYNTGGTQPVLPPQGVCILPDGNLITTEQLSCDAMSGDYQGDGTEVHNYMTSLTKVLGYPQSGVSFPGFSWIVCEGRTQSCYVGERRKWVDDSVPNNTYRNAASGSSTNTKVTHPRFLLGPSFDPRVAAGTMDDYKKYLFMMPKTHIMMDIFKHSSINMSKDGDSKIAKATHNTQFKKLEDDGDGGSNMVMLCKTCDSYFKTGMDLAFKNDTVGCGNPDTKAWTTVGGAPNLETAWNNGRPEKYFPGVEVLMRRRKFGTITGWIADMPTFEARRISTYSQPVLHQEIKNVQGENGWWFWVHNARIHESYKKCEGTYIF